MRNRPSLGALSATTLKKPTNLKAKLIEEKKIKAIKKKSGMEKVTIEEAEKENEIIKIPDGVEVWTPALRKGNHLIYNGDKAGSLEAAIRVVRAMLLP
ncbi:hypothetical protein U1Q18_025554 [Sarracenia purpurea var. burkii]